MGLFDKFKKKENNDWKSDYVGKPNFYYAKMVNLLVHLY